MVSGREGGCRDFRWFALSSFADVSPWISFAGETVQAWISPSVSNELWLLWQLDSPVSLLDSLELLLSVSSSSWPSPFSVALYSYSSPPSPLVSLSSWQMDLLSLLPLSQDLAGGFSSVVWKPWMDAELEWDLTMLVPRDEVPGEELAGKWWATEPAGEVTLQGLGSLQPALPYMCSSLQDKRLVALVWLSSRRSPSPAAPQEWSSYSSGP